MKIPTKEECFEIFANNKTPSKMLKRSKAACKVGEETADKLIKKELFND